MRTAFKLTTVALLFCAIVIPNSLKYVSISLLVASSVLAVLLVNPLRTIPQLVTLFALSAAVSLVYILVGQMNLAPREAATQVLAIYILAPLLWMLVSCALFTRFSEEQVSRWLTSYILAAIASVPLYFWLFLTDGVQAVQFFKEDANLDLNDGYAGATMFVYGSLIFLTGGCFAAPGFIKSNLWRVVILGGLPMVAITSGRSALILSIPMGWTIGLLLGNGSREMRGMLHRLSSSPVFILGLGALALWVLVAYVDIDLSRIVDRVTTKIAESGGSERSRQTQALLQGAGEYFWMGAGHGIGVNLVRSEAYPWRYEVVPVATLFRVGVLGALIYAAPFVIYLFRFLVWRRRGETNTFDLFMFAGAVAALLATWTNPYIEGIELQWMFAIPLVAMEIKHRTLIGLGAAPHTFG